MSKLDEIVGNQYNVVYHEMSSTEQIKMWAEFQPEVKRRIKNLFLELVGEPVYRETSDMTLSSWTTDDYKAFGKNELTIELKQKIEQL